MPYIIIGLVIVVGAVLLLYGCKKQSIQAENSAESDKSVDNPYEGLRNMAISTTPKDLQLDLPTDSTVVFGTLMEIGMDEAVVTMVTYLTGDASIYFSTGGGVIGGGHHQSVNDAAVQFMQISQTYLDKTKKTQSTPLPETDNVIFYFLTNKGIFVGKDQMKNIMNNSSVWSDLFAEGNVVMNELRLLTEQK